MAKTVLELCEEYTAHLSYDLDLAKKIEEFKLKWSYKNDDHLEFLASNLTGVHVIRFSARDEEMLYRDVFGVDKDDFEYELWRTPGINKNFKVSSNPTFMLLMFMAHKYLNTKLPKQQRADMRKLQDKYRIRKVTAQRKEELIACFGDEWKNHI